MTTNYTPEQITEISNGCSGGITWFYKNFLGRDIGCRYCCDEHDVAYFEGGSKADRKQADIRFRKCIIASKRPVRGWLFYAAVRLFGGKHFKYDETT